MQTYPKRHFTSIGQVFEEIGFLLGNGKPLVSLMAGRGRVSPAFRERIMLAVTSVNRCRYCKFIHSGWAAREGVDRDEILSLLAGALERAPQEEKEALLYAMHWAETGGRPEPDARRKLIETYGEAAGRDIEISIRTIMFGNYFGNSVDAALHHLSGGKIARPAGE